MRCEKMSGNRERGNYNCPLCEIIPKYYTFRTKTGLFGWLHDKKLKRHGLPYQVEIAGIFIKQNGRSFDLNRVEIKSVECRDCGKLPVEYIEVLWNRFKELASNGLLLLPPEGGW